MKNILTLIFAIVFTRQSFAQSILIVNDNDNITYNTDTLLIGMDNSIYNTYDYWSIPDSGVGPTSTFMSGYDLVIWYCSTDGVGLAFWDGSSAGNAELISYASSGKPLWIIGQDILYQIYAGGGTSFITSEFAYDFMGLDSYDYQSYVDDGGLGVPQVDRTSSAPASFPASISWVFSTLWYVDACTAQTSTLSLYEMGPGTYTFAGLKSMFHNTQSGYSVMSTLFDPALIDTRANRIDFLEESITYLLGPLASHENNVTEYLIFYPNPANDELNVELNSTEITSITLVDMEGKKHIPVITYSETSAKINTENLSNGMYCVSFTNGKQSKSIKFHVQH